MNAATVALLSRPYPEIVDDVLVAVVGGVVREPIFFDLKEDLYKLAKPASDIRSVTGTRNGAEYTFQKDLDYAFDAGQNAVVWAPKQAQPDDETTFYVNYFRPGTQPALTDLNVGSVTRTLCEAFSREVATVYQQINLAYASAFVDTAKGQSLDQVVAILGVVRKSAEFAAGLVTFYRAAGSDLAIVIPDGTVVRTVKGISFATSEMRTLQRGQVQIDAPVLATADSAGKAGLVDAGAITVQAQPLDGIDHITNLDATTLGAAPETDDQLRARAKATLRGLGKATLLALYDAVDKDGAKVLEYWDPNGPPGKRVDPGTLTLLVDTEPARFASLQGAVHETRAAGVQVTLVAHFIFIKPRVIARIAAGSLTPAGQLKLVAQIIAAMDACVSGVAAGGTLLGADLLKAISSIAELSGPNSVSIASLTTWRADVGRPGAESTVDAVLGAIADTPPGDAAALRTALTAVLASPPPTAPSSNRIVDRSFIQGLAGMQPSDADIAAGKFQVTSVVQGEQWWLKLDAEPADIVLVEA